MLPLEEPAEGAPGSASVVAAQQPEPGIDARSVLTRATSMSAASVLSAALAFPTSLVAARWVGPEDYGRAQLVLLCYFGAVLLRSGAFEGGLREFVHRRALGDEVEGRRLRDLGLTFDLLLSLIPALAFVALAGSFDERVVRVGFLLAPAAVLSATASAYLGAVALAEQRFPVVARTNSIRAVVAMIVTLLGILLMGPIGLLVGPLLADASVVLLYRVALRASQIRVPDSANSLTTLIRIGFPIGMGTIVYWAYRLTGSTSIALTGDAAQFGVYVFALAPVTVASRALAQVSGVLTPTLWTAMARDPEGEQWRREGTRLTVSIALIAGLVANLGHAWFGPLVHAVVPDFEPSIEIFGILVMNVMVLSLAYVPTIVLQSTLVNRQVVGLCIGVAALVTNILANVVVLEAGGGSIAIAVNDVWVQAAVVAVTFAVARRHLDHSAIQRRLLLLLLAMFAWTGMIGIALHDLSTTTSSFTGAIASGLTRTALVALAWGPPALAILRSRWIRGRPVTSNANPNESES